MNRMAENMHTLKTLTILPSLQKINQLHLQNLSVGNFFRKEFTIGA
jgi:hypothetical protein